MQTQTTGTNGKSGIGKGFPKSADNPDGYTLDERARRDKGNYILDSLSHLGQAGFLTWGALALIVVAIAAVYGIGKAIVGQKQFESAVVSLAKNVLVVDAPKENMVHMPRSNKFDVPVRNPHRVNGGRTHIFGANVLDAPIRFNEFIWEKFSVLNDLRGEYIPWKIFNPTQTPSNSIYQSIGLSVILESHIFGFGVIAGSVERTISAGTFKKLDEAARFLSAPIRAAAKHVSPLGALGGAINHPHSDSADNNQAVGKNDQANIAELSLFAEPRFSDLAIAIVGFVLIGAGSWFLTSSEFPFVGVGLIPAGIYLALYMPRHLFFW